MYCAGDLLPPCNLPLLRRQPDARFPATASSLSEIVIHLCLSDIISQYIPELDKRKTTGGLRVNVRHALPQQPGDLRGERSTSPRGHRSSARLAVHPRGQQTRHLGGVREARPGHHNAICQRRSRHVEARVACGLAGETRQRAA